MVAKIVDLSKYVTDDDITSISGRTAHFLDWASRTYPGKFFRPVDILQGIMQLRRTPRSNTRDALSIRNSLQGAQKYLLELYKRGLVSEPFVGYRATTDSEDVVRYTVTRKATRLNSAKLQLSRALDIVDPKTIPNTEEGKQWKSYYFTLKDATKSLFSEDFTRRLLPPKQDQL